MNLYSIFDSKAAAFLQPFFARNEGVAVRQLSSAISDGQHDFCVHAEDYTLFEVGSWDEVSGKLTAKDPTSVTTCLALKSLTNGRANKPADSHLGVA